MLRKILELWIVYEGCGGATIKSDASDSKSVSDTIVLSAAVASAVVAELVVAAVAAAAVAAASGSAVRQFL